MVRLVSRIFIFIFFFTDREKTKQNSNSRVGSDLAEAPPPRLSHGPLTFSQIRDDGLFTVKQLSGRLQWNTGQMECVCGRPRVLLLVLISRFHYDNS